MSNIDKRVDTILSRLKECRESKNISQLELSLRSGISQTMISQMESGRKIPTITTFLKICEALDILPETILSSSSSLIREKEEAKRSIIGLIEKWM